MDKKKIRLEVFRYLSSFGDNIKTKLSNICAKTGQYNVPSELFQKRTPRSNRVLMSWHTADINNLTIEQLNTFEGGIVIEFINNDYFNNENFTKPLFQELIKRIGSNDKVSAIISIRSEGGSSSSAIQREAFEKLTNNTKINYEGREIEINKSNYSNYSIKQLMRGGTGNEKWSGFLFVSIKGGQQDTIETHHGQELTIFNPACEYASSNVKTDIDLVVSYFMMLSIDTMLLTTKERKDEYNSLLEKLISTLEETKYDSESYKGNLLNYCVNHPSAKLYKNQLTDPIQLKKITIANFNESNREQDSIDFTHSEAVNLEKYYWDKINRCILSPARPTNIFWSFHLSNMMQQDYTLEDYFEYEKNRYLKRQELLSTNTE